MNFYGNNKNKDINFHALKSSNGKIQFNFTIGEDFNLACVSSSQIVPLTKDRAFLTDAVCLVYISTNGSVSMFHAWKSQAWNTICPIYKKILAHISPLFQSKLL